MNWLLLQTLAQTAVERILNALPEGLLIALFAWALLRILRRQNSGTRFAVWFLALLAVAALPVLGGGGAGRALLAPGMAQGHLHPAITISGRWALFAFVAWASGASLGTARLVVGFLRLRQLQRSCTAILAADLDPAVQKTFDEIAASGSITVAASGSVRVPAAIGFWKRTIVLPAWALRELAADDLNAILLHEFAHLRRGDDWTNLIQKMVRTLFFFHPAVWWIDNRLSVEREMACDDAVLAETANPHGYASCLVSLMEKSWAHRELAMAQAAVHRAREASLRLAQILDTNRPVATRVWKPALALVGVFSVACLIALPLAPQFVAFDSGIRANNQAYEYAAAVIPARLKAGPDSVSLHPASAAGARVGTGAVARPSRAKLGSRQFAPPQAISARMKEEPLRDEVVATSASANQAIVPAIQTLVFIEATQYRTSNSSVWSVQVWHVTFVSAAPGHLTKVPVASSI